MVLKRKVYLYSQECQALILPSKNSNAFGLYKKIQKKSSDLWLLTKNNHLEGTVAACTCYQRLKQYVDDVQSEIKKFSLSLQQHKQGESLLVTTRKNFHPVGFTVYAHNPLTIILGQAIELTDKLFLLVTALHHAGDVFAKRTMLTIKGKVRKRLLKIMGKMNQVSLKHMSNTTVMTYLESPSSFPRIRYSSFKKLLQLGLVKKYEGVLV